MRWWITLVFGPIGIVLLACRGEASTQSVPLTGEALVEASPPGRATATPSVPEGEYDPRPTVLDASGLAACSAENLVADTRGPVGATAMMTLSLIIRNVGTAACRLLPPEKVEFLLGDGTQAVATPRLSKEFAPIGLAPTGPKLTNEVNPPVGAAYIWLIWNWRSLSACHVVEPAQATVRIQLADGFTLETSAELRLAPCEGLANIREFSSVE